MKKALLCAGLAFGITLFSFSSCNMMDDIGTKEKDVIVVNSTDKNIVFTEFTENIDKPLPLSVPAHGMANFSYRNGDEYARFTVKIENENYRGRTTYVEDESRYILRIYSSGDLYKSQVDNHISYELKKIEENN